MLQSERMLDELIVEAMVFRLPLFSRQSLGNILIVGEHDADLCRIGGNDVEERIHHGNVFFQVVRRHLPPLDFLKQILLLFAGLKLVNDRSKIPRTDQYSSVEVREVLAVLVRFVGVNYEFSCH